MKNFRSPLETRTAAALREAGIEFEYEPKSFILQPGFSYTAVERGEVKHILQPITYKPDFVGDYWIIETKGLRSPDFDMRWKMFKRYLHVRDIECLLLMCHNDKQVQQAIRIIQNAGDNKKLLQNKEALKQFLKSDTESSSVQDEARRTRAALRKQRLLSNRKRN